MTSSENSDSYDLHRIHPNVRNDLQQIGNKIISEFEKDKSSANLPLADATRWDRAKNYSRKHKKDIALGSGAVAVIAVITGVIWQVGADRQKENTRNRVYALHEVLTHPIDLAVLGICPEDLRNQAKSLHGDQATAYRHAAEQESALAIPCTNSSVASLTINLPNASQMVITPLDILPTAY